MGKRFAAQKLSRIPFGFSLWLTGNGIPDKTAFLQGMAKKRLFRNDGGF
jgi:hypothetical protein